MPYPSYTGWIVQLDPSAVSTNRTMLDINNPASSGISIGATGGGTGPDWGTSSITEYTAQQSRYGSTVADYVWPNRTITIPLLLGYPQAGISANTALQNLREKVALFQREGGWLLRQRNSGLNLYADVVDAQLAVPDVWGETGGVEPGVTLTLITLPDFYGDVITLDTQSATGIFSGVITLSGTQADIEGDHPGRAQVIVTDASGNNQLSVLWGCRSRYYNSASTAALFYEAEVLTPVNGAAVTGLSGASGGDVVQINNLPADSWVTMLSTTIAATTGNWTHQGSYRVWCRAYAPEGADGIWLQFLWGVGSLSVPVTNTSALFPAPGAFYLFDLGEIRIDPPPVGAPEWFGAIQVYSGTAGVPCAIDCLYLQPLDDGAGQLTYVYEAPASSVATTTIGPTTGADSSSNGGTVAWSNPSNIATVGAYAQAALTNDELSHLLEATGFGFSLPSTATIQGIEVRFLRYAELIGATHPIEDATISLIKGGTVQATNRALPNGDYWPTSPTYVTYGGPSDLWGGTWAYSDINASNFGLAIAATIPAYADTYAAYVANVSIIVYITLASGFSVPTDAVMYADQPLEIRYDQMVRGAPPPEAGVYGPVSQVTGDLARIPPSGMESRAVQMFVKPTRGDTNILPDSGLDKFTVQTLYWPSWIFRP